jgi:hypothetical protein
MHPKNADALHALVELFRERCSAAPHGRTIAIIADEQEYEDQDVPGVHHGHAGRRPRIAAVYEFPTGERLR